MLILIDCEFYYYSQVTDKVPKVPKVKVPGLINDRNPKQPGESLLSYLLCYAASRELHDELLGFFHISRHPETLVSAKPYSWKEVTLLLRNPSHHLECHPNTASPSQPVASEKAYQHQ